MGSRSNDPPKLGCPKVLDWITRFPTRLIMRDPTPNGARAYPSHNTHPSNRAYHCTARQCVYMVPLYVCASIYIYIYTYTYVSWITLQYSSVQYNTVQYSSVQYSTVQHALQHSTVQYVTLEWSVVHPSFEPPCRPIGKVAAPGCA